MSEFNDRLERLPPRQKRERYHHLAEAALAHYALEDARPAFIRHNAGVTYRVESGSGRFLLKIAEPIGEGPGVRVGRIRSTLMWLAALARDTDLVVQEPVSDRGDQLLSEVFVEDLPHPFFCTLQRWIEGQHVRGDVTSLQAYRIGVMTARLHLHGSRWSPPEVLDALEQDGRWLGDRLDILRRVVSLGILSDAEWSAVERACERIRDVMDSLGRESLHWGPVHGDLHQDNLLFHGDEVRPVDFSELRIAHFPYDLGVTLYHLMYLDDVDVRRALIEGYESVRLLGPFPELALESFLCAAAFSNLSFQVTIPRERTSPLFKRNVREFATVYCKNLAAGKVFALP